MGKSNSKFTQAEDKITEHYSKLVGGEINFDKLCQNYNFFSADVEALDQYAVISSVASLNKNSNDNSRVLSFTIDEKNKIAGSNYFHAYIFTNAKVTRLDIKRALRNSRNGSPHVIKLHENEVKELKKNILYRLMLKGLNGTESFFSSDSLLDQLYLNKVNWLKKDKEDFTLLQVNLSNSCELGIRQTTFTTLKWWNDLNRRKELETNQRNRSRNLANRILLEFKDKDQIERRSLENQLKQEELSKNVYLNAPKYRNDKNTQEDYCIVDDPEAEAQIVNRLYTVLKRFNQVYRDELISEFDFAKESFTHIEVGIGKNWLEDNQTNFTDGIYLLTDAITAEDKENEEEQKSDLEKVEQLKDTIPDLLRGAVSSKKQKEIADETRVRVANEIPNDSAGFLLRIIHSPKYYMDRGWSDPHNDRDNGSRPVQHIMLESCNKKDLTSLILNSLLNYLYKRDLETGKMTQFDVEILRSINQEMTFVWKDISEKYPRYFQADLEPAGKITIKEVEKNERNDFTEYDHNDLGIIKVGQNSLFHIRNIEGRMLPDFSKRAEEAAKLKDEERIYAQLKERIPNFSQLPIEMLVKELSEQPDLNLSTNSLKTAMYHFIWESNKDEAQMRDVKAWANSEPKTGQMGELQKELKTFLETHNSKTYTRTLRNQFGKHWRRVENLEKFYGGLVGINYLIDANELVYAVGVPKGVNRAITRASVIKRIIPFDKDEKNISWYPDFIKLLETTTIRFKQTTVLPFIFKYIRKYAQLHKQDTKPGQEPGPFAYPVEMSF